MMLLMSGSDPNSDPYVLKLFPELSKIVFYFTHPKTVGMLSSYHFEDDLASK